MQVKTLTELKRTLQPGMTMFCVVNHAGSCRLFRKVEAVQSNAFTYSGDQVENIGWTYYPKSAKDFEPTEKGFRLHFGEGTYRRFIEYEFTTI